MIKLKRFDSAANNIILRNTAIKEAKDHDDLFYGEDKPDGEVNADVVEDITDKPHSSTKILTDEDDDLFLSPKDVVEDQLEAAEELPGL